MYLNAGYSVRMEYTQKTVLVFGTFDGLHDGHRFFLREARSRGDYLVAVVAPDRAVRELKSREPRAPHEVRRAAILSEHLADEAVIGDEEQDSWEVLNRHQPALICIGHDQDALAVALTDFITKKRLPITLARLQKA